VLKYYSPVRQLPPGEPPTVTTKTGNPQDSLSTGVVVMGK
ncbi:MAG: hypothetical protein ACI90V_000714, partial [Bacillariaceae sp.]